MLYLNCASIKNKIKTKYNKKQSKANVSLITTLPLHETLLCSSRPDSSAHEAPWVLAPGYRSSGLGRPRLFQSDLQFPQKCTTLYNSKLLHICSLSLKGSPPPPLDSRTGCGDWPQRPCQHLVPPSPEAHKPDPPLPASSQLEVATWPTVTGNEMPEEACSGTYEQTDVAGAVLPPLLSTFNRYVLFGNVGVLLTSWDHKAWG